MGVLEADYLVVGAGASGMAFTDALVTCSDVDVVMVDRRHRPGGHWNDDYPFVRLQPSACYGITSRTLGTNAIDELGPNAGFYKRASAAEICDYYQRALDETLLATGRVRFFAMHDYVGAASGEHQLVNRLTGEVTAVRLRRRLVDATHLESSLRSRHTPSFEVEPNARLVTPDQLVSPIESASEYTIIGAGKTSRRRGAANGPVWISYLLLVSCRCWP